MHEGERGDSTFVLLQGKVKVYSTDAEGREIIYGVAEAGDYFAEMWLDGGPRSASVMTLEPCMCSIVGSDAFREHLASDPEFALELVSRLIRRVREATQKARDLALLDVYGRVVRALEAHEGPALPGQAGGTVADHAPGHRQPGRLVTRDGQPIAQGSGAGRLRGAGRQADHPAPQAAGTLVAGPSAAAGARGMRSQSVGWTL